MKGYVHSIQSLGTVDGPGVRSVIFAAGCPLRCIFCHNPDTWEKTGAEEYEPTALAEKIIRFKPYIKDGGVTFSGGEPLLQAEFFREVARLLKNEGLHIALDTSGCALTDSARELLSLCDLVLLDIKFTSEGEYKSNTGASLSSVLSFLDYCEEAKIPVWIRSVIIPDINDTEEHIKGLAEIIKTRSTVKKVELLPFKKLCLEKYDSLGIPFPLESTPEMSPERLENLRQLLNSLCE